MLDVQVLEFIKRNFLYLDLLDVPPGFTQKISFKSQGTTKYLTSPCIYLLPFNTRFPLLRFRSALHCGYSGITDIQDGIFFVLTCARTFEKS